jgi:hypothetical protein
MRLGEALTTMERFVNHSVAAVISKFHKKEPQDRLRQKGTQDGVYRRGLFDNIVATHEQGTTPSPADRNAALKILEQKRGEKLVKYWTRWESEWIRHQACGVIMPFQNALPEFANSLLDRKLRSKLLAKMSTITTEDTLVTFLSEKDRMDNYTNTDTRHTRGGRLLNVDDMPMERPRTPPPSQDNGASGHFAKTQSEPPDSVEIITRNSKQTKTMRGRKRSHAVEDEESEDSEDRDMQNQRKSKRRQRQGTRDFAELEKTTALNRHMLTELMDRKRDEQNNEEIATQLFNKLGGMQRTQSPFQTIKQENFDNETRNAPPKGQYGFTGSNSIPINPQRAFMQQSSKEPGKRRPVEGLSFNKPDECGCCGLSMTKPWDTHKHECQGWLSRKRYCFTCGLDFPVATMGDHRAICPKALCSSCNTLGHRWKRCSTTICRYCQGSHHTIFDHRFPQNFKQIIEWAKKQPHYIPGDPDKLNNPPRSQDYPSKASVPNEIPGGFAWLYGPESYDEEPETVAEIRGGGGTEKTWTIGKIVGGTMTRSQKQLERNVEIERENQLEDIRRQTSLFSEADTNLAQRDPEGERGEGMFTEFETIQAAKTTSDVFEPTEENLSSVALISKIPRSKGTVNATSNEDKDFCIHSTDRERFQNNFLKMYPEDEDIESNPPDPITAAMEISSHPMDTEMEMEPQHGDTEILIPEETEKVIPTESLQLLSLNEKDVEACWDVIETFEKPTRSAVFKKFYEEIEGGARTKTTKRIMKQKPKSVKAPVLEESESSSLSSSDEDMPLTNLVTKKAGSPTKSQSKTLFSTKDIPKPTSSSKTKSKTSPTLSSSSKSKAPISSTSTSTVGPTTTSTSRHISSSWERVYPDSVPEVDETIGTHQTPPSKEVSQKRIYKRKRIKDNDDDEAPKEVDPFEPLYRITQKFNTTERKIKRGSKLESEIPGKSTVHDALNASICTYDDLRLVPSNIYDRKAVLIATKDIPKRTGHVLDGVLLSREELEKRNRRSTLILNLPSPCCTKYGKRYLYLDIDPKNDPCYIEADIEGKPHIGQGGLGIWAYAAEATDMNEANIAVTYTGQHNFPHIITLRKIKKGETLYLEGYGQPKVWPDSMKFGTEEAGGGPVDNSPKEYNNGTRYNLRVLNMDPTKESEELSKLFKLPFMEYGFKQEAKLGNAPWRSDKGTIGTSGHSISQMYPYGKGQEEIIAPDVKVGIELNIQSNAFQDNATRLKLVIPGKRTEFIEFIRPMAITETEPKLRISLLSGKTYIVWAHQIITNLTYDDMPDSKLAVRRMMNTLEALEQHLMVPVLGIMDTMIFESNQRKPENLLETAEALVYIVNNPDSYFNIVKEELTTGERHNFTQKSEILERPVWARIPKAHSGKGTIVNLGTSCFMNSILQLMANIPYFPSNDCFLSKNNAHPVHSMFQEIIKKLRTNKKVGTREARTLLSSFPKQFHRGQHCVGEFFDTLMGLRSEDDPTAIEDFKVITNIEARCLSCDWAMENSTACNHIALGMQYKTYDIDGNGGITYYLDKWKTGKLHCGNKCTQDGKKHARVQYTFRKLPTVLMVTLNRNFRDAKLPTNMRHIGRVVPEDSLYLTERNPRTMQIQEKRYTYLGCILHSESVDFPNDNLRAKKHTVLREEGHYICAIRQANKKIHTVFNDSLVTEMPTTRLFQHHARKTVQFVYLRHPK